jgi:DNA recombination protein RmuC
MSTITAVLLALAGLAVGAAVAWLAARGRASALTQRKAELEREAAASRVQLTQVQQENSDLRVEKAVAERALEDERAKAEEKLQDLRAARVEMEAQFSKLATEALRNNNQSFLELAKSELDSQQKQAQGELEKREKAVESLVKPISDSLKSVDDNLRALEVKRTADYSSLSTLVQSLNESQNALTTQTGNLVKALREPQARGRWGELQLRRCLELAGMLGYCDFLEQVTVTGEDGRRRPDVVVKLPGEKNIVVDAKVPLVAYLSALEAPDDATRNARLLDHARQVRQHVDSLSGKSYWSQFQPTPDFVVLFLPGEVFFRAAMDADPELIEYAVARKVMVTSPITLISLLRAVAYGWNQQNLAESARKISEAGKQLYDRLCVMTAHVDSLGKKLDGTVKSYNEMLSSMEKRLFPAGKRIAELDRSLSAANLPDPEQIEKTPRQLESPDWQLQPDTDPLLLESEDADAREP